MTIKFLKGNELGEVPKEYSILPIGFLNFYKDGISDKFTLVGMNATATKMLERNLNNFSDLNSVSGNFDDTFMDNLYKFSIDDLSSGFFVSNICSDNDLLYQGNLVRQSENTIYCFFCDDPNDNIRINQELKSFKSSFHAIFNHVPVGIVLLNQEGQVEDVNNYFMELFGYSVEEIVSQNLDELIVPENYEDEGKELTKMALNKAVIKREAIRKTKDGKLLNILVQGAPIIQEQQQTGVFLIYEDITQRRDALEKMRETGRKLEELHKVVFQMDSSEDEEELCQVTVEAAANILKLDTCIIVKVEGDKMIPVASSKAGLK